MPTMLHPAPPVPAEPPPIWVVPFISQIQVLVPFFHRMSDLPSPLKSPVPAMLHPAPPVPAEPPPICVVPFISQIQVLVPFRHRMSDLPVPVKSLGALCPVISVISVPLPVSVPNWKTSPAKLWFGSRVKLNVPPFSLTCSTLPAFSWTVPARLKAIVAKIDRVTGGEAGDRPVERRRVVEHRSAADRLEVERLTGNRTREGDRPAGEQIDGPGVGRTGNRPESQGIARGDVDRPLVYQGVETDHARQVQGRGGVDLKGAEILDAAETDIDDRVRPEASPRRARSRPRARRYLENTAAVAAIEDPGEHRARVDDQPAGEAAQSYCRSRGAGDRARIGHRHVRRSRRRRRCRPTSCRNSLPRRCRQRSSR